MRIVVDIQSGPRAGHKVMLRKQQLLVFGRTEWADVVFEYDARMSAKHFSLEARGRRLRLRDLDSSGGTTVNGEPVKDVWLSDGDVIVAGETRLAIRIDGVVDVPASDSLEAAPGAMPDGGGSNANNIQPDIQPAGQPSTITFTRETCRSGLTRLRGQEFGGPGQPSAASVVASVLAQSSTLTLVAHPQKLDLPQPADLSAAVPLFEWLPADGARQASPLIWPPESCADAAALIDACWDNNAILCIFSRRPAAELIQHLRDATRFRIDQTLNEDAPASPVVVDDTHPTGSPAVDDSEAPDITSANGTPSAAILGYCWPNVFSALIENGQPNFVRRLMDGIDAVLTEDPNCPNTWQIVCSEDVSTTLEQAGFSEIAAAET